jgi:hypothetical protein
MIPSPDIKRILFNGPIDETQLKVFQIEVNFNHGSFNEIHWLNTPGPIYTTCTDNCGTGQAEAVNNIGGDNEYREIIFKQPFTKDELKETLTAAYTDDLDAYFYDGNENWTKELIIDWWSKSDVRIACILELYDREINLPEVPDELSFGDIEPIPENYRNWLDFYQNGMKEYLEWYIFKLCGLQMELNDINIDWSRKEGFDKLLGKRETQNNEKS